MSEIKSKKTRVELKIEQKYAIIEYRKKYPTKKQTELIEYFQKLFKVKIPPTTMSGILSTSSRNKISKADDVEAVNKRIRECKYPDLERMLFVWYVHAIKKTVVSDDILILKAKEFGQMLEIIDLLIQKIKRLFIRIKNKRSTIQLKSMTLVNLDGQISSNQLTEVSLHTNN